MEKAKEKVAKNHPSRKIVRKKSLAVQIQDLSDEINKNISKKWLQSIVSK